MESRFPKSLAREIYPTQCQRASRLWRLTGPLKQRPHLRESPTHMPGGEVAPEFPATVQANLFCHLSPPRIAAMLSVEIPKSGFHLFSKTPAVAQALSDVQADGPLKPFKEGAIILPRRPGHHLIENPISLSYGLGVQLGQARYVRPGRIAVLVADLPNRSA
jgi:hypothetical protein